MTINNKKQFDFDLDLPGIELPKEEETEVITELNFTKLTVDELLNYNTELEIARACGNCVYFVAIKARNRHGHCVIAKPVKSNSAVRLNRAAGIIYPPRDATMHCKLHRLATSDTNSVANIAKVAKLPFNLNGDLKCKK